MVERSYDRNRHRFVRGQEDEKLADKIIDLIDQRCSKMLSDPTWKTVRRSEIAGMMGEINALREKTDKQAKEIERLTGRVVAQRKALRELNQRTDTGADDE